MRRADGSGARPDVRRFSMTEDDLDQVVEIEQASFRSPWHRRHFYHEVKVNGHSVNLVLKCRELVLAYASFWCLDDELTLNTIAVRPGFRRLGLAREMLAAVLQEGRERGCTTATLEVRESNTAALKLYGEYGFEPVGRRRGYYAQDGEDALILTATIAGR